MNIAHERRRPSDLSVSDEDLARAAQAGCQASFERLVRRYQVPLLRFVTERVRCAADAEDLVQEAFVRAWSRIDRYRDAWRFSTWLFTIANRLAVSHLRARGARLRREAGDAQKMETIPGAGAAAEPARAMADREGRQRFWAVAADALTEEQFAAVWLFYVEGLGAKEVAAVLGRSWVSVKTMLFRARRRLIMCAPELEGYAGGRMREILGRRAATA